MINWTEFDINLIYKCILFCSCKAAPCGGQSPLAPFVPLIREVLAIAFPGRNAAIAPVASNALYRDRLRRIGAQQRADLDWKGRAPNVVYVYRQPESKSDSESNNQIDLQRRSHRSHTTHSQKHHSWQTPKISDDADSKGKGSNSKISARPPTFDSSGADISDATNSVVTVGRSSASKSPSSKSASSGSSTSSKSSSPSTKDSPAPQTFGSSSSDPAPQTFGASSPDPTQVLDSARPSSVGTVTAPTRRRQHK